MGAPRKGDTAWERISDKERSFIRHLIDNNFSSKKAASLAYPNQINSELYARRLRNRSVIREAIREYVDSKFDAIEINNGRLLQELAANAFADPAGMFDANGKLLPLNEMPAEVRASIAQFDAVPVYSGKGKDREFEGFSYKVKFNDKLKALDLVAKMLGMIGDLHVKHSGEVEITQPKAVDIEDRLNTITTTATAKTEDAKVCVYE